MVEVVAGLEVVVAGLLVVTGLLVVPALLVVVPALPVVGAGRVPTSHTDRRLLPPHFSVLSPAHGKLQSAAGAPTEPALKLLPQ